MMMIKTFSGMNFDFPNKKSSEFALGRKIVRFAWRRHGTPPGRSSSQVSAALAANLANVWPEFFLPKSHTHKNLIKNTSSLTDMMKHFSSYRNATKSEGTGRSKLKELINRGWMLPNYVGICVAARWRWQVVLQYFWPLLAAVLEVYYSTAILQQQYHSIAILQYCHFWRQGRTLKLKIQLWYIFLIGSSLGRDGVN